MESIVPQLIPIKNPDEEASKKSKSQQLSSLPVWLLNSHSHSKKTRPSQVRPYIIYSY